MLPVAPCRPRARGGAAIATLGNDERAPFNAAAAAQPLNCSAGAGTGSTGIDGAVSHRVATAPASK